MAEIKYNKSIVKNINESLIRRSIQGLENFTKTSVTRDTGLSFPTVSRIIDEMMESGELLLVGMDASTGGRHAQAYTINPDYAYVLALYVRISAVKVLVVNAVGEVAEESEVPLKKLDKTLVETLEGVIRKKKKERPVRAISIGLPWGISQGKIEFGAEKSGLKEFKLEEHLEKKFKIPARVENDMNLIATGCYLRMFEGETVSLACLSIGSSGCGCGLYIRGHLIRGAHGFAGELRYLPMNEEVSLEKAFFSKKNKGSNEGALAQMVASVYAVVDPSCIVLYHAGDTTFDLNKIEKNCRRFLPAEVTPTLVEASSGLADLEAGLIHFGKEMLLSGYEIINR